MTEPHERTRAILKTIRFLATELSFATERISRLPHFPIYRLFICTPLRASVDKNTPTPYDGRMTFESKKDHTLSSQEAHQRASARRRLAVVFLRDAQRMENNLRTRADLAFDALYLCALASLDIAAEEYEHPSSNALRNAAKFLGLTTEQIQPAMAYAGRRYEPTGTETQCQVAYDELVALAKRLLKTK
jgi:hypothetical protein